MGALRWQAHLNPVLAAGLILGLVVWLIILYRRLRRQHPGKQAVMLLVPKVLLVLLLIMAYFDPVWSLMRRPGKNKKVAVLVDMSSSMEVEDESGSTRAERAADLVGELTRGLESSYIDPEALEFDLEVREFTGRDRGQSGAKEIRETDLGKCLVTIADKLDSTGPAGSGNFGIGGSDYVGVVLITDGGDEVVQDVRLPEAPVYITGVGSEPETWNDIAITTIDAPEVAEEQSDFEVAADIVVRSVSGDFAARAGRVKVRLEEKNGDGWQVRAAEVVDLAGVEARAKFRVQAGSADLQQTQSSVAELGTKTYRVRVETIEGELSELNNARTFPVEIRKTALPILLFAQQVGWDFSMVRKELARDPLVALTALFRISEDRFIVQGSRHKGDENLEAGFPSSKAGPPEAGLVKTGGAGLGLYRCVIVGSLPASQWQEEQLQALVEYVRQGGAVIFLGGEHSFGRGGYSGTVIEPLFPWEISPPRRIEPELQTGQFAVSVPLSAVNHSIISETSELISQAGSASSDQTDLQSAGATIESINLPGPLRSGAISLLEASVGNKTVPVVAIQRYGQGQTMAIATNTLWKWTVSSEVLGQAYSHFWRQAVRNLSQWEEGQRFVSVKWDKKGYRPGEQARATIRVGGRYNPGQLHLKATLKVAEAPDEQVAMSVPVKALMGRENTFSAEMVFSERAEYLFEIRAYLGENLLESYEKTLAVGPRLNEGANLQVDHAFLDNLATRGGGAYFKEADFGELVEMLRNRVLDYAVSVEVPLVQDRYIYLLMFLIILMLEWIVRRKMNLF